MSFWLLKTEPEEFGYHHLEQRGREPWNGVKNPTALKHLRAMQPGDLAFIYHTGNEKAIVGVAQVVCAPYPDPQAGDPRFAVVDVAPEYRLPQPVTLARIKADPRFAAWELVRQSRLSVMPVSPDHWQLLHEWGGR